MQAHGVGLHGEEVTIRRLLYLIREHAVEAAMSRALIGVNHDDIHCIGILGTWFSATGVHT